VAKEKKRKRKKLQQQNIIPPATTVGGGIKIGNWLYLTHLICTKFGIWVGVADVITCDNFFGQWVKKGQICGVENQWLPFTKTVAVNIVLLPPCSK